MGLHRLTHTRNRQMNYRKIFSVFSIDTWDYAIIEISKNDFINSFYKSEWQEHKILRHPEPKKNAYIADTLPIKDEKIILAERYNYKTGRGEIISISKGKEKALFSGTDKHYSFPFTFTFLGENFLILEHKNNEESTHIYKFIIENNKLEITQKTDLKIPRCHLIDPVIYQHEKTLYLFASTGKDATKQTLKIWHTQKIRDEWIEICDVPISKNHGRMGGPIISSQQGLFRLGQDHKAHYGNGLALYKITSLTKSQYQEEFIGVIRSPVKQLSHCIHTAAFINNNELLIDVGKRIPPFLVIGGITDWTRITIRRLQRALNIFRHN